MLGKLFLMLALVVMPLQAFAADAMFTRDKAYEVKGWSIFGSDDDIDGTAQLITELDTTYAQLAAEDNIEVLSASAADITQTVTVEGIDEYGDRVKEEIALDTTDGTTAVASTNTFRYIDQVSVDAVCAGAVTVRRATGDTFIISVPVGALEATVVQHFNGGKDSYLTGWYAAVTSTTGTVSYELRYYADDASCLSATSGYKVLDTIILSNALSDSYHSLPTIKCPKGGWIAVFATGGSSNADGSVRIEGYDVTR
jgi:hypothetical protein